MPNTYTQLYIHFVFAVQNRDALVHEAIREPVQKYMAGIISNTKHKLLSIYSMPDHTHIFLGLNPNQSISNLAQVLKSNSSKWMNKEKLCRFPFNWQDGYGAFSHQRSSISNVCNYVQNQKQHHSKKTFKSEYLDLLREHEVEYDDRYLFNFFDETDYT